MSDKAVAVVTGASQGIGREVAQQLAAAGRDVVMVARKTPRLFAAVEHVKSSGSLSQVVAIPADFSRMTEVRRLPGEINRRFPNVNVIVHCAAVILRQRQVTDEGLEATFATNVMAPFLLSHLLFDSLLIIDVQNAILDIPTMKRRTETHAALDTMVARIVTLLQRARSLGIPVLFVQHDGGPGHRLERGSIGWQIRSEIAPIDGELVIHKTACDSFFRTTLASELTKRKIKSLVVVGYMTEYCVDTSIRRLLAKALT